MKEKRKEAQKLRLDDWIMVYFDKYGVAYGFPPSVIERFGYLRITGISRSGKNPDMVEIIVSSDKKEHTFMLCCDYKKSYTRKSVLNDFF